MKVIMLCGGLGSRIKKISNQPKCLFKFSGETILTHNIQSLISLFGEKLELYINCRNGEKELYEKEIYRRFPKINLSILQENAVKGTAGTFLYFIDKFKINENVVICYGDQYYQNLLTAFKSNQNILGNDNTSIIFVYEGKNYQNAGVVIVGDDGFVQNIIEKPKSFNFKEKFWYLNAGIYLLNKDLIANLFLRHSLSLNKGEIIDFAIDIFPKINFTKDRFKICKILQPLSVDTPERYIKNDATL